MSNGDVAIWPGIGSRLNKAPGRLRLLETVSTAVDVQIQMVAGGHRGSCAYVKKPA